MNQKPSQHEIDARPSLIFDRATYYEKFIKDLGGPGSVERALFGHRLNIDLPVSDLVQETLPTHLQTDK